MPFEMLFQGIKDTFRKYTVNKHCLVNAILTELKKPGCNSFHSYDDADIDMTKLPVRSSLKCLITEISENKDLTVLLLYQIRH